jgi:immune inhibitor A
MRRALPLLLALAALALAACAGPAPTAAPTPTPAPVAPGVLEAVPTALVRDPFDLVRRFKGVDADPLTDAVLYAEEPVGTARTFNVVDVNALDTFPMPTRLVHAGERALWYVAEDITVDPAALAETARAFDERIHPQVLTLFGERLAPPGHIAIVIGRIPAVAGYFNAADALPTSVYAPSNQRVGVFMASAGGVSGAGFLGTLAHEFTHVLQWRADPSEATWVTEGQAEYAARALGLGALPFDAYLREPEAGLAVWPPAIADSLPSYAAASLFARYLAEQVGPEALPALLAEPADGFAGIEAAVPGADFETLYAGWLVANLVGQGPQGYQEHTPTVTVSQTVSREGEGQGTVQQTGGWYLGLDPADGPLTVRFTGTVSTPVIPGGAHSGEACWWSGNGEGRDATLTRALDLRGLRTASLRFWSWQDIEEGFDGGHVAVSADAGVSWQALSGSGTSEASPLGLGLGPMYSGRTEGWAEQRVDLTPYAGAQVILRFEYLTDEAVEQAGWCVDDIAVPEAGFFDDAETEGNWEGAGFVRVGEAGARQRYLLRLVEGVGPAATVRTVTLDAENAAAFTVERPAVLVVGAWAPGTGERATFTVSVEAP